ncbi:uncharacterized protein PpBr36_11415 [Pyricularia pennisetigena]|nr:uncharacterized protein PpBr36_11415 [Pyricularia pennisetigena]TLS20287.1 hypothetical protein PpBr36_11415 [Pyricularia pennisetigena]
MTVNDEVDHQLRLQALRIKDEFMPQAHRYNLRRATTDAPQAMPQILNQFDRVSSVHEPHPANHAARLIYLGAVRLWAPK